MDAPTTAKKKTYGLSIAAAALWFLLLTLYVVRAYGLNPMIMPDEYIYMMDIRHRTYADARIANYLYYFAYSPIRLFGDRFLDAARVLNAIFFMLSAPFVYRISRMVCPVGMAAFLTFLIMIWPFGAYSMFLMPESLYFTGFWVFAWLLLKADRLSPPRIGVLAGVCIGAISLIKSHGVFLLPGFALFMLATTPGTNLRQYAKAIAQAGITCALTFLAVRLGLGYAFAGPNGLALFGRSYTEFAGEALAAADLSTVVRFSLSNLFGSLAAIGALLALPFAIALSALGRGPRAGREDMPFRRMSVFAFSFLLPLMAITSVFMSYLSFVGEAGSIPDQDRIVWRYYSFIFPLLLILAGGVLGSLAPSGSGGPRNRLGLRHFLVPALLGLHVLVTGFQGYAYSIIPDCVELGSPYHLTPYLRILVGIALLLGVMALFFYRQALALYLLLFLPAYAICTGYATTRDLRMEEIQKSIQELAGKTVRQYLGDETDRLVVIDRHQNPAYKALFFIDNPTAAESVQQPGGTVDMDKIPPGTRWVLCIGRYELPEGVSRSHLYHEIPYPQGYLAYLFETGRRAPPPLRFTLDRVADFSYSVDLSPSGKRWPISAVERRGREIRITYAIPLPEKFAFGLTAGAPMSSPARIAVSGQTVDVGIVGRDGAAMETIETDGSQTIVKITLGIDAPPAGLRFVVIPMNYAGRGPEL